MIKWILMLLVEGKHSMISSSYYYCFKLPMEFTELKIIMGLISKENQGSNLHLLTSNSLHLHYVQCLGEFELKWLTDIKFEYKQSILKWHWLFPTILFLWSVPFPLPVTKEHLSWVNSLSTTLSAQLCLQGLLYQQ